MLLRTAIGQELRRERLDQNRSLKFVADAANVSFGYLSEVERGLKEPSSELLEKMSGALGLKMSSLLLNVVAKLDLEELIQDLETVTSENFEVATSSSVS